MDLATLLSQPPEGIDKETTRPRSRPPPSGCQPGLPRGESGQWQRWRQWIQLPHGAKNKQKLPIMISKERSDSLRSHILEIKSGSDIMGSISAFASRRRCGVSVAGRFLDPGGEPAGEVVGGSPWVHLQHQGRSWLLPPSPWLNAIYGIDAINLFHLHVY
ncbi:hypothetical protein SAY86_030305 [Trapa natans]|uniref:Uncharacterized protein n=1 Tax=Trapa natans TaxID=22666 RepID=A0AAN7M3J3_TRANT|nr:hypothetical protein SAY86_030305 [Trapa natans]